MRRQRNQVIAMEQNNHGNKSLFLYTALIFFVAVILIILAFFGQTNVQKNQPPISSEMPVQTPTSITERTSVVSEENAKLIQEVSGLKAELDKTETELANSDLLLSAYDAKLQNDADTLASILGSINYEQLTDNQKAVYDKLQK